MASHTSNGTPISSYMDNWIFEEMSKEYIIINPAVGGTAKTVVAGYHKCYAASLLHFGTSGTFIMEREITESNVLRMERTEEERQRRHNEGDKGAKFSAAKELKPRRDGISNTLTSSAKDNLLLEKDGRKKAFEQAEKICENLRGGSKPVMKADGTIRGANNRDPKHGNIGEFVTQNENNPAMTVTTAHAPKCYGESTGWRIRKLTSRENVSASKMWMMRTLTRYRRQEYQRRSNTNSLATA